MGKDKLFEQYRSTFYDDIQTSDEISFGAFRLNYGSLLPRERGATILDFGCGSGTFLRYLASEGFNDVIGVEVSSEQAQQCSSLGLTNVLLVERPLEFLQHQGGKFDFIMMRDVLEHIEKPHIIPLLEGARDALKPGGLLVIRVPNAVGVAAAFSIYLDFTHELGFTEVSLTQVLKSVGFQDITIVGKRTYYRSTIKGWLFEKIRLLHYKRLKWQFNLERPGDKYPKIFTNTIIGIARR